ncbi:MAG TPA: EamA family transporter [Nocardioidaceae bacterium]|nr:EamA family transporter [Nocardioidaceae bacterium]
MTVDDHLRGPQTTGQARAVWLVLGGIVSVQVGAAIAKDLFSLVPPTAMVWLRLLTSAVILVAIARPRLRGRSAADLRVALGFGVTLMVMNWAIYQSFARIPLGIAVTIEFLGPLAVAVLGSRRPRDLVWVGLAAAGVVLLGLSPGDVTLAGVLFALLAGAAWAGYILLSASTGRRWPGISGLAVASVVGAVALAPPAVMTAGPTLLEPKILALGLAIGLLSSVIPYSFELKALRRIPPRVFGVLMSLEPAAAALAAMVLLSEFLTVVQWTAVACVVAASVGATRSSTSPPREPAPN